MNCSLVRAHEPFSSLSIQSFLLISFESWFAFSIQFCTELADSVCLEERICITGLVPLLLVTEPAWGSFRLSRGLYFDGLKQEQFISSQEQSDISESLSSKQSSSELPTSVSNIPRFCENKERKSSMYM